MADKENSLEKIVCKTIMIYAPASKVWESLTNPGLIQVWMLDTEIQVISEWKVGSRIIFKGNLHWIDFENRGTILQLEPGKVLEYTSWSTLSGRADTPENYTVITFMLTPADSGTTLTFTQCNFATDTEYKHANFYWNTALVMLKQLNEK